MASVDTSTAQTTTPTKINDDSQVERSTDVGNQPQSDAAVQQSSEIHNLNNQTSVIDTSDSIKPEVENKPKVLTECEGKFLSQIRDKYGKRIVSRYKIKNGPYQNTNVNEQTEYKQTQ